MSILEVTERKDMNIIDTTSRDVLTGTSRVDGENISNLFADLSISDPSWMVNELFQRPHLLSTTAWTTAMTPGTAIYTCRPPLEAINGINLSSLVTTFRMFSLLRCGMEWFAVYPGTRFYVGQLFLGFLPLDHPWGQLPSQSRPLTVYSLSGYPGVLSSASNSRTSSLTIPHTMVNSYMNTFNLEPAVQNFGTIGLWVFNQLQTTGSNVPNMKVNLFFKMIKPELKFPTHLHTTTPTLYYSDEILRQATEILVPKDHPQFETVKHTIAQYIAVDGIQRERVEAHGLDMEGLLKSGVNIAVGAAKGFIEGGPEGAAIGAGTSAVKELMSNLDRPISYENCLVRTMPDYAYADGNVRCERLSLMRDAGYFPPDSLTGSIGKDMDLLELRRRPMLIDQIQWNDTDVEGTVLWSSPVHPGATKITGYAAREVEQTYLSYTSRPFNLMRGGIDYDFQAIISGFHTGAFIVGWQTLYTYGSNPFPVPTTQNFGSWQYMKVDIAERTVVSVRIPYAQPREWQQLHNLYIDSGSPPNTNGWNVSEAPPAYKSILPSTNGRIFIMVLQPLQAPEGLTKTVDINIFHRAAPDFETAQVTQMVPQSSYTACQYTLPTDLKKEQAPLRIGDAKGHDVVDFPIVRERVRPEMEEADEPNSTELGTEMKLTEKNVDVQVLAKEQEVTPPVLDGFFRGQKIVDMRDLIRCYGYYRQIIIQSLTSNSNQLIFFPVHPSAQTVSSSWMSYFARMYAGWSGSIRYRFMFELGNVENVVMQATHLNDLYDLPDNSYTGITSYTEFQMETARSILSGYRSAWFNVGLDKEVHVEVPYAQGANFLEIHDVTSQTQDHDNSVTCNGVLALGIYGNLVLNPELHIYAHVAAGDDFAFNTPIPPPLGAFKGVGVLFPWAREDRYY